MEDSSPSSSQPPPLSPPKPLDKPAASHLPPTTSSISLLVYSIQI